MIPEGEVTELVNPQNSFFYGIVEISEYLLLAFSERKKLTKKDNSRTQDNQQAVDLTLYSIIHIAIERYNTTVCVIKGCWSDRNRKN